ncbi:ATPase, AAA-type, core [Dillenia turbinata]|uniref:Peroxisomal ATPase PEX6 n=1 Tax=Dillenia turbinata TaxID=194707 RepID=A0AAN8ZH16_9MAGN
MVERRKPLVLSSTKALINSVLTSPRFNERESHSNEVVLPAGILRFSKDKAISVNPKLASLDDSSLIGLSTSLLKRLSITSGSLVLVRNLDASVQRVAQVFVLDPPNSHEKSSDIRSPISVCCHTMITFPTFNFPESENVLLEREVAYICPLLAFNLDLHISCFKVLVHRGKESLASLFEDEKDEMCGKKVEASIMNLRIEPWTQKLQYASHLRASFVKIPECGTLESLKGSSPIEAEDRQEMIDLALKKYFEVDRLLARGDLFNICINWSCNSVMCIPCSHRKRTSSCEVIYFKVVAIEPSDEPILLVNNIQTALVLGGSVSSALPPDLLIGGSKGLAPIQRDIVKTLAAILVPPLCPSALSSKFRVAVFLYGLPGCGKRTVVRHVARRLGLHVVEFSCHNLISSSERRMSSGLAQAFVTARRYSPSILLLRHFDVFRDLANEGSQVDLVGITSEVASVIREFTEPNAEDEGLHSGLKSNGDLHVRDKQRTSKPKVLLVAAAETSEGLPSNIRRCFSHEISMSPLNEEQRKELLSQSLQRVSEPLINSGSEAIIKDLVGQTSGFMPRDLRALVADAGANLVPKYKIQNDDLRPRDATHSDSIFNQQGENSSLEDTPQMMYKDDIAKALERSKKRNASALGTPKVPNVKWEDVGGLEDVKKSILDTVQGNFHVGVEYVVNNDTFCNHQTLLAKAVATECSLNFLSVKGPELINMYIGESEKNVRDIFQKARSARPCVIFFDELDSLAPARGASGDSGGVMDRVVSQMLAEIDGLNDSTQDLFIIGASNRPDLIDPALLRPGRFDKLVYVGVNADASYRESVLLALTRQFKLHEDVSLYSIAKKCPPNFTGADMYALCADAWFHAAKRKVSSSQSDSSNKEDQADYVVVEYRDFLKVLVGLSPSLSLAELKKYELLRDQFEGASK